MTPLIQLGMILFVVIAVIVVLTIMLAPIALVAGVIYGAYRRNKQQKLIKQ